MLTINRQRLQSTLFTTIRKISSSSPLCRNENTKTYPLQNVRVLDLTRIVAGPYCTMILSDLGAEIIKIERPFSGDESRKWGPPFLNNSVDSVYFLACNRNKKSVSIDMKRGSEIIVELAKKCDVLVENYVPGKLDEYNLSYEKLKSQCPRLIYCSITGYGSVGPYSKKPGYDVIASSIGGLMHITGAEDGPPAKVGVAMTDLATGLYAHGAILAALLQRQETGVGQKIDVNLLSTQVACLINVASNYLNASKEAKRWGTAHESIVPYEAFPTKTGYLTVGAGSDSQFRALCKSLQIPEYADNPKFKTNPDRVKHRQELIAKLSSIFAEHSNEHWMKLFEKEPFPAGPINSMKEVFADPHVQSIELVKSLEHPTAGTIKVVAPPVVYSGAENNESATLRLRLQTTDKKKVSFNAGTIDNENMNKKKSKCCCIFKKPLEFGESSSEDDEDECDNCFGHVEKKKKKKPKDPDGKDQKVQTSQ
ncbi:Succinate--hydroxymethylglutarate CoA-transferase [Pseudolycoriella hygida]|uniref:Succinate--hydroxymethylglutarate CoA-transferase n=1 Tax=Pseudolycoriella hygida TaxID=35572 RepID=A0A9Q0NGM9_9DIPT|nr:Succinate--hydroxymethylglutarate CoA-transferase [Pseudolycoriella hygida]